MATWIVRYTDQRDVQDAIKQLQGYKLLGGNLILSISPEDPKVIIVKSNNIVEEKDLDHLFGRYGQVFDITQEKKGEFILLTFVDPRDAEDAVRDMNGREIDGVKVKVEKIKSQPIVQLTGVSLKTKNQDLVDTFERYGRVLAITHAEDILDIKSFHIDTSKHLKIFRDNHIFSDLELIVSSHKFLVHRVILASGSGYFQDILTQFASEKMLTLEDVDIDSGIFKSLLDLIYGKDISLQGINTIKLLKMAVQFDVKGIDFRKLIPMIDVRDKTEAYELQELANLVYPEGIPKKVRSYLKNLLK